MSFMVFGHMLLVSLLLTLSTGRCHHSNYKLFHGEDHLTSSTIEKKSYTPDEPTNLQPNLPSNAKWQTVSGTTHKFRVYSAFYEHRRIHSVWLIGITKTHRAEPIWCKFWHSNDISTTIKGKIRVIPDNRSLNYTACFIVCPLSKRRKPPMHVSLIAHPDAPHANMIEVVNLPPIVDEPAPGLVVCIKQLHFSYNRPMQLIEFFELNKLLGATHFMTYNHSVGKEAACVLEHYKEMKTLTLLPWEIDISPEEIWINGQFAAFNDCIYRNMYHYAYAALIDIDEFIIPQQHRSLSSFLAELTRQNKSHSRGAFNFQNAFFYLQWADRKLQKRDSLLAASLITQRKTRRRRQLQRHCIRSKYICRPERIVMAGNHYVFRFISGNHNLNIRPEQGLLHHYRDCESGESDCMNNTSLIDETACKYKKELVENVGQQYKRLKQSCNLPDIKTAIPLM